VGLGIFLMGTGIAFWVNNGGPANTYKPLMNSKISKNFFFSTLILGRIRNKFQITSVYFALSKHFNLLGCGMWSNFLDQVDLFLVKFF
jgi:hypothetical protein